MSDSSFINYYIIIPAHNEEAFLASTLNAVLDQSLKPAKVVVVNDNSSDDTESTIDAFTEKTQIIRKVNRHSSDEHMPGSKVVHAFNQGLTLLDENYDFLVKLDADTILPKDYFEKIAFIFKSHPKVGIAGGFAYEQDSSGEWKLNHPMNKDHVRGAFKAYSKACFTAIGGLRTAMGWDTVDELLAQYYGFETFTDNSLKVKFRRPVGKAYSARAKLLQGEAMFTMRYGLLISIVASLKMAWKSQKPRAFLHNLKGFFSAKKRRKPYLVSPEQGKFIRKLRWKSIKSKLF